MGDVIYKGAAIIEPYGFIYMTINLVNRRRYIGKKRYDKRGGWKTYLGSGKILKRALEKHGRDNFRREILAIAYSSDELNSMERYWIAHYDAVRDPLFYNIASGGDGGDVRAGYTKEELEASEAKRFSAMKAKGWACGESASGSILTESDVLNIIQMLNDGVLPCEIAKEFGVSPTTICDIRHRRTWKHLTGDIDFSSYDYGKYPRKSRRKAVDVFDSNNRYLATYESARIASEALGVGYRLISQVCLGEKRTSHGYVFRFAENKDDKAQSFLPSAS